MSERLCLLQSERSLQLAKRGPTFLRVERDPVRTGGWRVAVLDSVRKKVVANLDVAVPCRCDFVHHPDVPLNIGVNSDALLLRKDRPRLWEIRAHNPSDEKSIERLFEPGLALTCPLPHEFFDARHDGPMRRAYLKSRGGLPYLNRPRTGPCSRSWPPEGIFPSESLKPCPCSRGTESVVRAPPHMS